MLMCLKALYCHWHNATDLNLISLYDQLPEADVKMRQGVWHIQYSFRDVQGLLLVSAQNIAQNTRVQGTL